MKYRGHQEEGRQLSGKKSKEDSKEGGPSCGPSDFAGVWDYTSQGGGVGWKITFECSPTIGCQYAEHSSKGSADGPPCSGCGLIPPDRFYVNDEGYCAFAWSDDLAPCYGAPVPDACAGSLDLRVNGVQINGNFWELRFCEVGSGDADCPTSYNEDTPRLAIRN